MYTRTHGLLDLFEEHLEEASFLYEQRARLLETTCADDEEREELERRLEAHLDALALGVDDGVLPFARERILEQDAGELHAVTRLFCRCRDEEGIREALDVASDDDELLRAVEDGLAAELDSSWREFVERSLRESPPALAGPIARAAAHAEISLGATLVERVERGELDADEMMRALAWQRDPAAAPVLRARIERAPHDVAFTAARALLSLDEHRAVLDRCRRRREGEGWVCIIAALAGDPGAARMVQRVLASRPDSDAILAWGLLGAPSTVTRLITWLEAPECTAASARALYLITGAPLLEEFAEPDEDDVDPEDDEEDEEDEEDEDPEDFVEHAAVNPGARDESVVGVRLSRDPDRWRAWWTEHHAAFAPDRRFRLGQEYSASAVLDGLACPFLDGVTRAVLVDELAIAHEFTLGYRYDHDVTRQRACVRAARRRMGLAGEHASSNSTARAPALNNASIAITGAGMVSALALDIVHGCAALRAGLARTRAFPGYEHRPAPDEDPEPLLVHAVPLLTEGFEQDARLTRLLYGALVDLRRARPEVLDDPEAWWFLAVPATGLREDDSGEHSQRAAEMLRRACAQTGSTRPSLKRVRSASGRAGFVTLLELARAQLLARAIDRAIVMCVDSLIDSRLLDDLTRAGRLKADGIAAGLHPGEVGAAFVLEREADARVRPLALLGTTRVAAAETESGEAPGVALASVISACVPPASTRRAWALADLNGEVSRAMEWGHSIVRLGKRALELEPVWCPAEGVGDTGAAAGGVALCAALRAFSRGYAPDHSALITVGDERRRACVELEFAPTRRRGSSAAPCQA